MVCINDEYVESIPFDKLNERQSRCTINYNVRNSFATPRLCTFIICKKPSRRKTEANLRHWVGQCNRNWSLSLSLMDVRSQ